MASAERQAMNEPSDNKKQTLPSAPSSLCFKKDEFMQVIWPEYRPIFSFSSFWKIRKPWLASKPSDNLSYIQ